MPKYAFTAPRTFDVLPQLAAAQGAQPVTPDVVALVNQLTK